jgi:YegS/Rv2252/BmrU family lipid kinase
MPCAYLIYNPYAGRYPSWLLAERAAKVLMVNGWQIHLEKSRDAVHLSNLTCQAADEGMDALFIIGGDGSVNLALKNLLGTDTALAVLPAGTSNVWAQELGLPGLNWTRWMALEESAQRLAYGRTGFVDVGMCGDRPFLLWAGAGLDAFIVNRIEPRARWEKHFAAVHYATSAVWNASFWHGLNLEVFVDGTHINGHYLLAVVSNIHLYAGGLAHLSPQARLDDGLLELWLFQGNTIGDTVQHVWDVLSGRHTKSERVEKIPFVSLTLKSESPLFLQLDGEPLELDSRQVSISVQPKMLKILVPKRTPQLLFR